MNGKEIEIPDLNVVYWSKAKSLISKGYQAHFLREQNIELQPKYFVVLTSPKGDTTKVILDRRTDEPKPALIEDHAIYNLMATNTKLSEFTLPLASINEKKDMMSEAVVRPKKPNPRIPWSITVDGFDVLSKRGGAQSFKRLTDALRRCYKLGAPTAKVEIPEQASALFKTRQWRYDLCSEQLEQEGRTLHQWAISNGYDPKTVYHVLNRGDESDEIRRKISRLVKKSEEELWPNLEW